MLLSGVRSSCDMLARNSDLYFEVSESSVAFSSSARRACSISWFLRSTSTLRSASCCAFCSSCSLVCCSSFCWVCNSPASCCDCFSRPSVCIVASIVLSTMPIESVSCSRKVICEVVNELTEDEFDHRLDLVLEQHRQHHEVLRACTRSSAELIGTASVGMSDTSRCRLSHRALSDQAFAELHDLRMRAVAVAGIGRQQPQLRIVLVLDLVDHAHMGVHQRRQLGQQQPSDRGRGRAGPAACW